MIRVIGLAIAALGGVILLGVALAILEGLLYRAVLRKKERDRHDSAGTA